MERTKIMEAENFFGLLLRLLPAVLVFAMAFFAMADRKTRERWNSLLYQIGSIRPDQREDVKIGRNVKWPFFVVAAALLLWPIQFYRHATRTLDAAASDLHQKTPAPQSDLTSPTNSVTENNVSNSATPQSDLRSTVPTMTNTPAPQSDLVPAPR